MQVQAYRAATEADARPRGDHVGPVIATPITTVITRCNQDSENLYAECLLKRLGHEMTGQPGSWANGAAIARAIMHERLDEPSISSGLVIADGSGLSRENRISPRIMTLWLNSFDDDADLSEEFIASLATAGETGTLSSRFSSVDLHGAAVHAKTGYIDGVSCLSGFVTSSAGQRMSFSIMVNDLTASRVRNAKKLQEQIVGAMAEHLSRAEVTLGGE
jgi:D-alanyl-D-alanine carboxypeptidase/D-alanyl-D-alanine-endopeptidase (penicillin-binding protein 4)